MAKVAFSKLNTKINMEVKEVKFNEQIIEIKEYLPFQEKIEIVEKIINAALNNNVNYYNPAQIEVFEMFYIISYYTNLTFTTKQQEDLVKLYDLFVSSGLARIIISNIADEEMNSIEELLHTSLNNIYQYNNSIFNVLETLKEEYEELDSDVQTVANKLADKSTELKDLKDILINA